MSPETKEKKEKELSKLGTCQESLLLKTAQDHCSQMAISTDHDPRGMQEGVVGQPFICVHK